MNTQQNLNDIVNEMSSILLTLQSYMVKVMNGINQLNLIITKIKQYNANNINNNMINNMMNINNNIQDMAMGMNNVMGMQGMNMLMPMNGMMNNMNFGMKNLGFEGPEGWILIFEDQNDRLTINIKISEQKLVKEAISMYKLKTGRTEKCKFIFNNHELFPEMKIYEAGLSNLSKILVYSVSNVRGGSPKSI